MLTFSFHLWATVAAVIASVVLGFLWYGPLFGKPWMKMMGMNSKQMTKEQKKGMAGTYFLMILSTLVSVLVLGTFIHSLGATDAMTGAVIAFFVWLGFVTPITLGSVLWEGKPWALWMINNGYNLVSYMIMGAILGAW